MRVVMFGADFSISGVFPVDGVDATPTLQVDFS